MASKTEIGNRTLSKLGQPRVSNIDTTNTKGARTISDMWDIVRDAMLRSYPWNFAIKRTDLAPDTDAPSFGWDNAYSVPVDCLSLIEVLDGADDTMPSDQYRFEGGKILSNTADIIYIRYIAQITTTGSWDALFTEAFASRLAYEGCEQITQSNTKKAALWAEYKEFILQAFAAGAIENPPTELIESAWLMARN